MIYDSFLAQIRQSQWEQHPEAAEADITAARAASIVRQSAKFAVAVEVELAENAENFLQADRFSQYQEDQIGTDIERILPYLDTGSASLVEGQVAEETGAQLFAWTIDRWEAHIAKSSHGGRATGWSTVPAELTLTSDGIVKNSFRWTEALTRRKYRLIPGDLSLYGHGMRWGKIADEHDLGVPETEPVRQWRQRLLALPMKAPKLPPLQKIA
jgi:hypothetical protein